METIIYKGNQIRKWSDGTFSAYIAFNNYEDIEEVNCSTLEKAQEVIDKHMEGKAEWDNIQ